MSKQLTKLPALSLSSYFLTYMFCFQQKIGQDDIQKFTESQNGESWKEP